MNVLFEPHPKQEEFIKAVLSFKYKYLLYGGAAGGGKTFVSIATLIILAKFFPGSRWAIVRESLPSLKRTTIPSFFKVCPENFIKSYNQTDQVVTFTNRSQLFFFPENYNADKFLTRFDGLEVNGFVLEEGQELQSKTFEKAKLRAGRHILKKQPPPLILITCNPSQGWTKTKFYEPFEAGELPGDHYYIKALMADNPSLDQSYIDGLKNLDETTYETFVRGNWEIVGVEKPFAYSFSKQKHVFKGLQIDKLEPLLLSFDFNVDPITCIAGQSTPDKIRILKEFRLRNSNIYELCEAIKVEFGEQYYIVTGDASGTARSALTRGDLNYYKVIKEELQLSTNQFKVPNFNPSIKNSRVLTNSILSKHLDLLIDSGCNYLIEDLQYVEVGETGDIDKTRDKHRTHLLDCFRYYLFTFHNDFVKLLN